MWYHIPTSAACAPTMTWTEQKSKLRHIFSSLTDADLNYEESARDEMLGNMQVKLARTKIQLYAVISRH